MSNKSVILDFVYVSLRHFEIVEVIRDEPPTVIESGRISWKILKRLMERYNFSDRDCVMVPRQLAGQASFKITVTLPER